MCMYIKRCANFVKVPYSSTECAVFCKRNLVLSKEAADIANDWFIDKKDVETIVEKTLYMPKRKKRERPIDDNLMEVLDPTERVVGKTLDLKEVLRRNSDLEKYKVKDLEEIVDVTKEDKDFKTLPIEKIRQRALEKAEEGEKKGKGGICPYCKKEFKNLQAHLKFCKVKKVEEITGDEE